MMLLFPGTDNSYGSIIGWSAGSAGFLLIIAAALAIFFIKRRNNHHTTPGEGGTGNTKSLTTLGIALRVMTCI